MLTLEPLFHRDDICIAIRGRMSAATYQSLLNFPGREYSQTHRCFYLRYKKETLIRLRTVLQENNDVILHRFNDNCELTEAALVKHCITIPSAYPEKLVRMRYSKATYDNYMVQFRNFLIHIFPTEPEQITEKLIHEYLLYLIHTKHVSIATQNQAVNAINSIWSTLWKEKGGFIILSGPGRNGSYQPYSVNRRLEHCFTIQKM